MMNLTFSKLKYLDIQTLCTLKNYFSRISIYLKNVLLREIPVNYIIDILQSNSVIESDTMLKTMTYLYHPLCTIIRIELTLIVT